MPVTVPAVTIGATHAETRTKGHTRRCIMHRGRDMTVLRESEGVSTTKPPVWTTSGVQANGLNLASAKSEPARRIHSCVG